VFLFNNVTKTYNSNCGLPITALKDITFKINEKEFISLVGKSGSGKTTLLKLLLAEEKPTVGRVFFYDQDIQKIKQSQLHEYRKKIGTVFQDYKLLPSKNTYENVAYVLEVIGASNEEIEREVPQVLEVVGLTDRAGSFPHELSGGERQRVSIARALIHRPDIILADEPTGNLDPYNTSDIIRLLVKIYELGTTVILATHNKEIINSLGKRVVTIDDGKIIRDQQKGKFIL
jgi:cell division transport system ATP-binding protein